MICDFLYSMMMLIMFLEGVYKFVFVFCFVKYRCNWVYNKLISFIVYLQILVK